MTKCHSDEAKAQKKIMGLSVWTKNAKEMGGGQVQDLNKDARITMWSAAQ